MAVPVLVTVYPLVAFLFIPFRDEPDKDAVLERFRDKGRGHSKSMHDLSDGLGTNVGTQLPPAVKKGLCRVAQTLLSSALV